MSSALFQRAALLRLVLALLGGFFTGHLGAMSVAAPTFSELVAESDTIVRGTVTRVESRKVTNRAGYELIHTFVTLTVEDSLKGSVKNSLILSFLGGRVGEESLDVSGMPQFSVGQRDILFIARNGEVLCPLIAADHGRYRVVHDPTSGSERVLRANGAPLQSAAQVLAPLENQPSRLSSGAALSVAQFTALIKDELHASSPAPRATP